MISVKKDFNDIPAVLIGATDDSNAWRDESVLNRLKELYHNKCAYCETKTDDLRVDHYRPQKSYPWLKNEWSNLLLSCGGCKDVRDNKTDIFPIKERLPYDEQKQIIKSPLKDEDKRADSDFLLSEKPLLLHPEIDTVENHFYFEEEGEIIWNSEKGQKTITAFNLNRNDLKENRKEKYNYFFNWLLQIIEGEKEITELENFYDELSKSKNIDEEFSLIGQQMYFHFENFFLEKITNVIKTKYGNEFNEQGIYKKIAINNYFRMLLGTELKFDMQEIAKASDLVMPYSILGFSIKNFQGIKELSIEHIPLNMQWIFLTGENGYGKTSILKALLTGLIGMSEFRTSEMDDKARIKLQISEKQFILFDKLFNDIKISQNIINSNRINNYSNVVAAYGSKRTDLRPDSETQSVSDNLFERTNYVLNTPELLKTFDGNDDLLAFRTAIIDCIKILIPKLHDIEFTKHPTQNTKQVKYIEKDDNGNILKPVSFEQLAMGMRGIIGLVGDIILKLSQNKTFVSSGSNQIQSIPMEDLFSPNREKRHIKSISELSGIVIIDEIDIHLHPKWQRMLVEKLTEIFPKVQFIVSTHSPIPLLGAPAGKTVILNVNRTKEDGITATRLEQIEKELPNLLPNVLLTSPVFGLSNIKSSYNKNIKDVIVDDNYNDRERYEALEMEIDELFDKNDWENNELFKEEL